MGDDEMVGKTDDIRFQTLHTAARVTRKLRRVLPRQLQPLSEAVGLGEAQQWLERQATAARQQDLATARPAVDCESLKAGLRSLGLPAGRIIFVHSSLKALGFVEGGPSAVVDALIQVIVDELGGTLALPTFSLTTSMADALKSGEVFDARTTPSAVGAVTEHFRNRAGVVRSLHPTHSVAALGPEASWLCGAHHTCGSTFGTGSPLARLLEKNGVLLGLGTSLGPVTFYHVIEDLKGDFPVKVYTADSPFQSVVKDVAGNEHVMPVWAHDSDVSRTRIDKDGGLAIRRYVTRYLEQTDRLRWGTVGIAPTWWLPAREMYAALEELVARGVTIYTVVPSDNEQLPPAPRESKLRLAKRLVARPVRGLQEELLLSRTARARRRRDQTLPALDPGADQVIDAAVTWLSNAQRHSRSHDGGMARDWSYRHGWSPSYPETTGYIVPTLLEPEIRKRRPEAEAVALTAARWLVSIQLDSGGFRGGVVGGNAAAAVTFNTGQILMGLAAARRALPSVQAREFEEPLRKAADWLVAAQDDDGAWRKSLTSFAMPGPKAYETHTAWGLLEAARVTGESRYANAALRQVDWALGLQQQNGWFDRCCLSDRAHPLTHTLAYTVRGVLEAWRYSGEERYLRAALRTAEVMASCVDANGMLAGRFGSDWSRAVPWSCLTGSSQMAICWGILADATGDAKLADAMHRVNQFVRRTVTLQGAPGEVGGIAGSFPIDGAYGKWEFLNWAAKFTIDAQLQELGLLAAPHSA
jgi:aminoglycoside N3'-acetyltransferase